MWIKLTVCGVTRLGYGHPDGKTGGNAIKEIIGDALRNAAMRFGAALNLWHKGELHVDDDVDSKERPNINQRDDASCIAAIQMIESRETLAELQEYFGQLYRNNRNVADDKEVIAAKNERKVALDKTTIDDEIPDFERDNK